MTSKDGNVYKPLETLTVKCSGNSIPALSSFFAEARLMVPFSAPPKQNKNGLFIMGAKDTWINKMTIFKGNMEWLLGLNHQRFWSQIVYGADTWDAVISFLQEAYPFYAMDSLTDDEDILKLYYQIYYLVFDVLTRAMTKKESEANYIGKKYGSLLYNYTLISVPMLIDICVLYGDKFQHKTAEMLSNVFTSQPLYVKDLENSVQSVKMAFSLVEEKFTGRPLAPGETKLIDRPGVVKRLSLPELQDVVLYLLDISASLTTFLEMYPEAALMYHNHKFEIYIARLYEHAFPAAVQQVHQECDNDEKMSLYVTLMCKLNNARFFFIKLFRLCVQASLELMFNKQKLDSPDNQAYLDVMSESLAYSIFMKDYHLKFPIDHDLDAIAQNCPDFDNIKYNFLLESFLACFDKPAANANNGKGDSLPPQQASSSNVKQRGALFEDPNEAGGSDVKSAKPLNCIDEATQAKINDVKDCLPNLGDGFILKCLERFNMEPSTVVNAILEDTLPNDIKELDRELPFIPPEEDPDIFPRVYGEAEFTKMIEDLGDNYTVHKGKRQGKEKDLKEILDDKSFRKDCSTWFSQLGIIDSMDNIYDDEYDDTYDDSELPVPEVGEPDRKFVVPRILQQGRRTVDSGSDDDEGEEGVETKPQLSYHNFLPNPEDIRAKYQQNHTNRTRPPRNVVGNPKGQGQDKDVLKNRHIKTVHKSTNRKKAAQYKKSKGMF